jgi:hypothetical protein
MRREISCALGSNRNVAKSHSHRAIQVSTGRDSRGKHVLACFFDEPLIVKYIFPISVNNLQIQSSQANASTV